MAERTYINKRELDVCCKLICFLVAVNVLFIGHHYLNDCPVYHPRTETNACNIIYLKHPTAFANHSVITTKDDYDRVLNVRNISSVRKIEDRRLEVDGKMVILFANKMERDDFVNEIVNEKK